MPCVRNVGCSNLGPPTSLSSSIFSNGFICWTNSKSNFHNVFCSHNFCFSKGLGIWWHTGCWRGWIVSILLGGENSQLQRSNHIQMCHVRLIICNLSLVKVREVLLSEQVRRTWEHLQSFISTSVHSSLQSLRVTACCYYISSRTVISTVKILFARFCQWLKCIRTWTNFVVKFSYITSFAVY